MVGLAGLRLQGAAASPWGTQLRSCTLLCVWGPVQNSVSSVCIAESTHPASMRLGWRKVNGITHGHSLARKLRCTLSTALVCLFSDCSLKGRASMSGQMAAHMREGGRCAHTSSSPQMHHHRCSRVRLPGCSNTLPIIHVSTSSRSWMQLQAAGAAFTVLGLPYLPTSVQAVENMRIAVATAAPVVK